MSKPKTVRELSFCIDCRGQYICINICNPFGWLISHFWNQKKLQENMVKLVVFSVLFAFFFMGFLHLHVASSTSFKPETSPQGKRSCPYTVIIKTSCSSTTFTRDQISLAYGDAFGNEVIRSWSCD